MTDTTPPSLVVACATYAVTLVGGRAPAALGDLAGPATFVVQGPTGEHEVCGEGGEVHDDAVRFYEKNDRGTGKDVRVWTVSVTPEGGFVATC